MDGEPPKGPHDWQRWAPRTERATWLAAISGALGELTPNEAPDDFGEHVEPCDEVVGLRVLAFVVRDAVDGWHEEHDRGHELLHVRRVVAGDGHDLVVREPQLLRDRARQLHAGGLVRVDVPRVREGAVDLDAGL